MRLEENLPDKLERYFYLKKDMEKLDKDSEKYRNHSTRCDEIKKDITKYVSKKSPEELREILIKDCEIRIEKAAGQVNNERNRYEVIMKGVRERYMKEISDLLYKITEQEAIINSYKKIEDDLEKKAKLLKEIHEKLKEKEKRLL